MFFGRSFNHLFFVHSPLPARDGVHAGCGAAGSDSADVAGVGAEAGAALVLAVQRQPMTKGGVGLVAECGALSALLPCLGP